MKDKVQCPYCGEDVSVDTDDWYDEDDVYEHQCEECGKYCMVRASVSWSYHAETLDCKNGLAEHTYKDIPISSSGRRIRCCKVCGHVEENKEK